ncbi:MAG: outer membrane beta-barrel protein [Desulfobacca sp.]|nr:outer membrane beta-barrel protein [Desulfobacca sp.]
MIIASLCLPGSPAYALSGDRILQLTVPVIGIIGTSTIAYYLWKNSPAQRAKGYPENLGPGEWYVAAYSGLSYLPEADWKFYQSFSPSLKGRSAQNVCYDPAVIGGLKFGHFFDSLPWFGFELEMNFSRHAIPKQEVSISPSSAGGPNKLTLPNYRIYIWALQYNLLARYGFLKDKEVPFGRLQPYVGIGHGFEVLYGTTDSAKNFSLAAQAGLRYMLTKKIAMFWEYKFSHQFEVEIEKVAITPQEKGTISVDVPHHRMVIGISYHFKNLFGN